MSKYVDPDIVKHLRQKENLALTLEIERYAPNVKTELLFEFWSQLIAALNAARPVTLPSNEFAFEIKDKATIRDEYYEISSTSPIQSAPQPHLVFMIGQRYSTDEFSIYAGIAWTAEVPKKSDIYQRKEIESLRAALINDGYTPNPWWLGLRDLRTFPSPEHFLLSYVETPKEIVESLVEPFWQMASKYRDNANDANKALRKGLGTD